MSTIIKPEVSKRNKYWIDKHRYYELKHFCLQYKFWRDAYLAIDGLVGNVPSWMPIAKTNKVSDPTAEALEAKMYYWRKIKMVEDAARETDSELYDYILKAVIQGLSYEQVKHRYNVPCSRDTFYDRYRRFFWILNQKRK